MRALVSFAVHRLCTWRTTERAALQADPLTQDRIGNNPLNATSGHVFDAKEEMEIEDVRFHCFVFAFALRAFALCLLSLCAFVLVQCSLWRFTCACVSAG